MTAKVLRMVYQASSTAPPPPPKLLKVAPTTATSGFASMLSLFSRSSTSTPVPSLPPPPPPPPKDSFELLQSDLSLKIVAVDVKVSVSRAYGLELERATKKAPPSRTRVALVFTGKDEWEAGEKDGEADEGGGEGSVWRGLRADLDSRGLAKVFIGHATGQTTGIGGHLWGRFISTVERESLDLV